MLKGLRVGALVNYVLGEGHFPDGQTKVRPAIVVNDWPQLGREDGYCNLQVFTDGRNDGSKTGLLLWVPSRVYSETKEPGTWHWPTDPPTPFDGLAQSAVDDPPTYPPQTDRETIPRADPSQ